MKKKLIRVCTGMGAAGGVVMKNTGKIIRKTGCRRGSAFLATLTAAVFVAVFHPPELRAQSELQETWEYVQPSSDFHFEVVRFEANPIIHREMEGLVGDDGQNINGPSLIRVPEWVERPLGKYYLYFAHHSGTYIRLAYADRLEGPWKIHKGGVLPLEDTPVYDGTDRKHIASPDILVDHEQQQIRMYYHGNPPPGRDDITHQVSYVALSNDGIEFESLPDPLGRFYFRVFRHGGRYYALAKYGNDGGIFYRSQEGLTDFEEGPRILPRVRHMAVWKHSGMMYVFFSRAGDAPEHILVSRIENPEEDWSKWRFTEPQTVITPERDYEGVEEPVEVSGFGSTYDFVHQLRDPAVFEEEGRLFLLYTTAGERAIAIAELFFEEEKN